MEKVYTIPRMGGYTNLLRDCLDEEVLGYTGNRCNICIDKQAFEEVACESV